MLRITRAIMGHSQSTKRREKRLQSCTLQAPAICYASLAEQMAEERKQLKTMVEELQNAPGNLEREVQELKRQISQLKSLFAKQFEARSLEMKSQEEIRLLNSRVMQLLANYQQINKFIELEKQASSKPDSADALPERPNQNSTNIDCEDCVDCENCVNCKNCSGCKNCANCTNCTNCNNCVNCEACVSCDGCSNCNDCAKCADCSRVANMTNTRRVNYKGEKQWGTNEDFTFSYGNL